MLGEIQTLQKWLQENYPSCEAQVVRTSSGKWTLEWKIQSETYALEELPGKGLAISKLGPATLGWEPVGSPLQHFKEAKREILSFLSE